MRKFPGQETLCCCEYTNDKGETSHMIACCCDCEALDKLCDRCLTCKEIPNEDLVKVLATVEDRCRVPWCSGKGAFRLPLDIAFPAVIIPCCLLFGTLGKYHTIFSLCTLPSLLFSFHVIWCRATSGHRRTRLFYTWGLLSTLLMFITFEVIVIGFREILLWENMLFVTLFGLMMYSLYIAKQDPGIVTKTENLYNHYLQTCINMEASTLKNGINATWCEVCKTEKPPRSGHCPVCSVCIQGRDHHCVWIDGCVGARNHRAFVAALALFLITGCYGTHLTMTTICTPTMYLDWFLKGTDCRFLYSDFPTAMSFVSVCYSMLAVIGMTPLFFHQMILISQNLTSQELHRAHQQGNVKCCMVVPKHPYNRGLVANWKTFLRGGRINSCIPQQY